MSYYFSKTVSMTFEEALNKTTEELKPVASMQAVENEELLVIAKEIQRKLQTVVNAL